MIRRTVIALLLGLGSVAWASDEPAPSDAPVAADAPEAPAAEEPVEPPVDDEALSRFRTRFDALSERTIGTTSRPVEFNWRRTSVQVAATGSYLAELNNFNSMRAGGMVRLPTGKTILELGASWAGVWDSPSSEVLALTPYRQPGRPSRVELDAAMGFPLAEGVVTTFPRFFPAVQMVFNAYGGVRYSLYPSGFQGMKVGKALGSALSLTLSEEEIDALEEERLLAMQIDRGRVTVLGGIGNDLYFASGFFLSPRLMVAVPVLAPATRTELYTWFDLSLAVGVAW